MVGQYGLQALLKNAVELNALAGFVILEGPVGSGKKTLAEWLMKQMTGYMTYKLPDVKIDTVRTMIQDVYTTKNDIVVFIPDADKMSVAAKNSLLKIVEEPPNNARFILTTIDSNMLMATIRSRASIYRMEPYSYQELQEYTSQYRPAATEDELQVVKKVCRNPGDVQLLFKYDGIQFVDFVDKVVENLQDAPLFNAMKIGQKISMKDGADGYDLEFFWQVFVYKCLQKALLQKPLFNRYSVYMQITLNALKDLSITGINKQMLFDKWLIELQEVDV